MVHSEFSEKLLQMVLLRIPFTQVITVPNQLSIKTPETYLTALHALVQQSSISNDKVNYICVESNYGQSASEEINTALIDNLLLHFNNARILAFGGTTASLVKALAYRPSISVIGKGPNVLAEITIYCGRELQESEIKRIFTISQFRDSLSLEGSEFTRSRSMSSPEEMSDYIDSHNRSASLPITPLFCASAAASASAYPSESVAGSLFTSMSNNDSRNKASNGNRLF